ncbi:MAG: pesticidal protein Cry7Aa [Patescibacteria group bacterium]
MVKVKKHGIILRPTRLDFENKSVFNPGVFQDGETVHLIYRGLNKNNVSYFGYARLKGPTTLVERWKKPFMSPQYKYDKKGVEDARIVKIKDIFYLTYMGHDGENVLVAYCYGKDLFNLKRGGIISPQISYDVVGKMFNNSELKDKYYFFKSYYKDSVGRSVKLWDKDAFLFPEKIKGKYALVHRILPDIQVIYFRNFKQLKDKNYWKDYIKKLSRYVILENKHWFEARNVGGGCPPVKTKYGWLLIYHGVEPMNKGRVYHAGAALLDLKEPTKVIARLPYPLFSPTLDWEKEGQVHDVVFPTGTTIFKERLYIYYGAADKYVAAASLNLKDLLKELMMYKENKS